MSEEHRKEYGAFRLRRKKTVSLRCGLLSEKERRVNTTSLKVAVALISKTITENRDYLITLDQQNGDGDLGISMSDGFRALAAYVQAAEETDLGKLFFQMSRIFNDKAPSSLGTILSFSLMGMARSLKGKEIASLEENGVCCLTPAWDGRISRNSRLNLAWPLGSSRTLSART
jgi:hypothetical protein